MPDETLTLVRTVADVRDAVAAARAHNRRVALVPTMGSLHLGHLSLIEAARNSAETVVVSIFVNPGQFAAHEDLDTYPRNEAGDCDAIRGIVSDAIVYAPSAAEMYPNGFQTSVNVGALAEGLCANTRPHFFGGVATVVAKLFTQVGPDVALFGEKDYQQLLVVRRMARDLDLPLEVVGVPTVREADGLAMSSRNAYLTDAERAVAPELHQALRKVGLLLLEGETPDGAIGVATARLSAAGFDIDYVEVRDAASLTPVTERPAVGQAVRVFGAAVIGSTRLIDNVAVPVSQG